MRTARNAGSFFEKTRTRTFAAAIMAASVLLTSQPAAAAEWRHPRGDNATTSLATVNTLPARSFQIFPVGPVAAGANPVIGPDGKLYIGTLSGELRAFHADGTLSWTRQLYAWQGSIFASPVVGADGSIYVVSTMQNASTKDNESFLHKFSPGGGWVFWQRFPKSKLYPFTDGGATTAAPNIWSWNGTEAIMVPVVYKGLGREDVTVVAFSTNGAVYGTHQISVNVYDISGGSSVGDWMPYCLALNWCNAETVCWISLAVMANSFPSPPGPSMPLAGAGFPLPSVAIMPGPNEYWSPLVTVTDGRQTKKILRFGPQTGFIQVTTTTANNGQYFTTPPIVYPEGTSMVGTSEGLLTRTGPDYLEMPAVSGLGILTAAPTRLNDGGLVVVARDGKVSTLSGSVIVYQTALGSPSIAPAAASCTHVFVSTADGLVTFSTANMQKVASVLWMGGGLSAPVIGPTGHVYAIASGNLLVFPAPAEQPSGGTGCNL